MPDDTFSVIPVIAGPTASGKTAVAVRLAEISDGEVISADSMQVYRYLSIGTAKPTAEELNGIPYHLIDHVNPNEQYNLGRFCTEAKERIADIRSRGKLPIICGGTGLYIKGLIYGIFSGGEANPAVRRELDERLATEGLQNLYLELQQVDPNSARLYGPNDRQRVLRALEVFYTTGKPLSSHHTQDVLQPSFPVTVQILSRSRQNLYDRINHRVDLMVQHGLLDEVKAYLSAGWSRNNPAVKALGYEELIESIEEDNPVATALDTMKQKSRNYAKRQETWFRSMPKVSWISADVATPQEIAEEIFSRWKNANADVYP